MTERAAIFDVDGTLVDSNDAHAAAWADVLNEFGMPRDPAEIRRLIGMGGDKLLPAVAGLSAESERGQEIVARRSRHFHERYLPKLRAFPGARALVERMVEDGVRLAIASSAREDELAALLDVAGVADLIRRRTSSDDVDASKPDPDAVKAALERLGVPPAAAIMIGDTPYDVAAAAGARVASVAVRCGGWNDRDLAGARAIFDGPADLLQRYDELRDLWARVRDSASAHVLG